MTKPPTQEEQRVQAVIDDVEAFTRNRAAYERLYEKLDTSLEKSKGNKNEYTAVWEAIKLFLASVLGAVGGVLIGELVKNWDWLFFGKIIAVLFVFSLIFTGVTYFLPNWRRNKKKQ
jgi:phosphatidylglycerophosphate synthase